MPLRGAVSHSETISAPSQCRTLGRPLEAVYGPYSTSAPCTRHSTNEKTRSTARRKLVRALSPVSSGPPEVAILTVITRQKSHSARLISEEKEIGCYRVRGRGRGCDPADPHGGGAPIGPAPTFPSDFTAMELSTNPVPALSALATRPSFR